MGTAAVTAQLVDLQKRLSACLQTLSPIAEVITEAKAKAAKKAAVLKQEKKRKALFSKHDTDKDGKLNRKEVIAFAKNEYAWDLDKTVLDTILGKIHQGKTGVLPEHFQWLRALVTMD